MVQDENDSTVENNKDEDNTAEPDVEDRLRLVLESAMKPTEKLGKMSEESLSEFTNRLSSFSPLTYFGKPSCLSPLVCARLGWRNAEPDLLVCSSCHAALAITLHSGLSPDSKDKVCQIYREKLATCHKANCPFTVVAQEFLKCHSKEDDPILPSYMMDAFPSECVELVEHPRPSALLQSRVLRLQENCPGGYKFPQISQEEIPQGLDSSIYTKQLNTSEESVSVLAILGWEPRGEDTKKLTDTAGDLPVTLTLGCRFCYSSMEVSLEKEDLEQEGTTTTNSPPTKKTRLSKPCAPLDAHRHYCPYVCGFPLQLFAPKKPMWKTIVTRLQKEAEENSTRLQQEQNQQQEETQMTEKDYDRTEEEYDQTVYRINDILNSAIAPVDPRLAALEDDM